MSLNGVMPVLLMPSAQAFSTNDVLVKVLWSIKTLLTPPAPAVYWSA
jgi:hypothetical protein